METASEQQTRPGSPRMWWLAALLSYMQPGLGQVYNGQATKGLRFFGAWFASLFVVVVCLEVGSGLVYLGLFLLLAVLIITSVSIVDALLSARRQPDLFPRKPYNHWYTYVGGVLVATLVITPVWKQFVQTFFIPSETMQDTLYVGDYILADMTPDKPVAGEVILYESLEEPVRMLIKRCVAAGGQIVEIRDKVLYVDGSEVPMPPDAKHVDSAVHSAESRVRDNYGPIRVPSGHFFMMGDNRDRSRDSRYTGPAPLAKIKGKAVAIYWSATLKPGLQLRGWPKPLVDVANAVWNFPSLYSRTRFDRVGTIID
ncbi:MAG: signal peptidase I [Candidatus Latescibacteria bacterium]|nr:signal peptidase I [Candidatus Latescibacterota bacterium]